MSIITDILDIDEISDGNVAPDIDLIDSFSQPLNFTPARSFLTAESHTIRHLHHTRLE